MYYIENKRLVTRKTKMFRFKNSSINDLKALNIKEENIKSVLRYLIKWI